MTALAVVVLAVVVLGVGALAVTVRRRVLATGAIPVLLSGLILAAAGPVTAVPVAPASPVGGVEVPTQDDRGVGSKYEQTVVCVEERPEIQPVDDGVSAAQRSLRFTGLEDLSRGRGVVVAVIDTGVTPSAAFGSRLKPAGDVMRPRAAKGGLSDCDGHGTLVAGIIAGRPDRETGFQGVAPRARVLSYRHSSEAYKVAGEDRDGVGTTGELATAIDAVVEQGADVINISSAYCGPASGARDPELDAAVERAVAADVVVVVAAGNTGEGDCTESGTTEDGGPLAATPANIPAALTVGALTQDGAPADFSLGGDWVDVAAPGEGIVSVNPVPGSEGHVAEAATTNGVTPIQGTSFSAPYVSGVVALVRARFPELDAEQVMDRITRTATHPAGPGERSEAVGYGVVNPRRALTALLPDETGSQLPMVDSPSYGEMEPLQPAPEREGTMPALLGGGGLVLLVTLVLVTRALRARRAS